MFGMWERVKRWILILVFFWGGGGGWDGSLFLGLNDNLVNFEGWCSSIYGG